jgi:cell wall-associated NlpC family hydrolase
MRGFALMIAALTLSACSPTTSGGRSAFSLLGRARAGREPPTTGHGWAVVEYGSVQVGRAYCWGGTGPQCFDCSGLVQRAWRSVGVRIPRTADRIASDLPEVPLSEVRAGDILWWPGHVGIYAGNGWMIDALDTAHGVVRRPAPDPRRALRPPIEQGARAAAQ